MANFSSSQISDMISRRKYEVKRGDTLSELAESFMKAFPTLNRFSRSNIEDMIFSENSSNAFKDRNKSLLLEGKYLELKFILEARRREFRFDHSAKEYTFTDEDRLAFAINKREFWDHFCRCDRNCGEFLRESLKEQGLSSLPKSMSLNHKISGSCCHKYLIENVKREFSSSKKVVQLEVVAEKILTNIGFASPSKAQIEECCKKLAEENKLNTCRDEKCTCIALDQTARLSTKFVEAFYKKNPLNNLEIKDLEQGIIEVKGANFGQKTVEEKLKNLVGKVLFIEPMPLFHQRQRFVTITEKTIKQIISKHKSEMELLTSYVKFLTGASSCSTLINNWAFAKLYHDAKQISISSKTYVFKDALKLLTESNRTTLSKPENGKDLVTLVHSLAKDKAKTFTFDSTDESLKFLFDDSQQGGSVERGGGGKEVSFYQIKNRPLTDRAKKGLINASIEAFYHLGMKFEKVIINSSYRTHGWQAEYLVNNPDKWYKYGKTEKLMEFVKDIYNGILDKEYVIKVYRQEIQDSDLLSRINDLYNNQKLFNGGYIAKLEQGNKTILIDVLEEIFKKEIYRPSEHPYGKCFDLHVNNSGSYIYDNHTAKKISGGKLQAY